MQKKLFFIFALLAHAVIVPAANSALYQDLVGAPELARECPELPGEIVGHILAYVDERSLTATSGVSRQWHGESRRRLKNRVNKLLKEFNDNHNTALRYAVKFNLPATTMELIRRGADFNHRYSADGKTSLDVAVNRKSLDVQRLLQRLGARSSDDLKESDEFRADMKKCSILLLGVLGGVGGSCYLDAKQREEWVRKREGWKRDIEREAWHIELLRRKEEACIDYLDRNRFSIYEETNVWKNNISEFPFDLSLMRKDLEYIDLLMALAGLSFNCARYISYSGIFLGYNLGYICEYSSVPAELNALYLNITGS